MATSSSPQSPSPPRLHRFDLVEGMQLQINVSGSCKGRNVRLEFQLQKCSSAWIIHWGCVFRGNMNWFVPNSASHTFKQGSLQTPFTKVLKTVRKEVLKGCRVVFSRIIHSKVQAENHHLWKMAEQLGAICSTEVVSSVTHVIALDAGTEKSRWALEQNKFLVHPLWLEAANYMWRKQPEDKFPVTETKSKSQTQ